MADSNVIREFLVRLGFKVDQGSQQKFDGAVQNTTANVTKLALGVAAASVAVGKMVASVSKDFEDLYFSAQRANSTAESMQALGQAAESFGVSAGEAKASAHSLFMTLQKNPGTEGIFKSLGIQTRDAKGQLLDTERLMMGFFAKAKKMPSYLAYQYGGMLGISDDLLQAGMQDGFTEKELQRRLQAGYANNAAQSGHNEQEKIRDAQAEYLHWLEKVNSQMPPFVKELGGALGVLASFVNGPMAAMLGALGLWKMLPKAGVAAGASAGLGAAEAAATGAAAGAAGAGRGGFMAMVRRYALAAELRGINVGRLMDLGKGAARLGVGGELLLHSEELNTGEDKELARRWAANNAKQKAMAFFMKMGWSKDQAAGIVANLSAESGLNPNAVGDHGSAFGLAQWHPDRQAAFERYSGKSIAGSTMEDQLAFVNYEMTQGAESKAGALLRAARNARQAGEIFSRYYERPADLDGQSRLRGEAAVQIAQTTTINVNGASDPVSTAKAVADAQNSVNAATMRNAQTRVQ